MLDFDKSDVQHEVNQYLYSSIRNTIEINLHGFRTVPLSPDRGAAPNTTQIRLDNDTNT